MNNTIKIVKNYEFLDKAINVFQEDVITAKTFTLIVLAPIFFYSLARFFDSMGYSNIIWGGLLFLGFISFCVFIVMFNEVFMEGDTEITTSKTKFYRKRFALEEQEKLSRLFGKTFDDLIEDNHSEIRDTLIEQLGELENTLYTREFLQSLKDAITENPENDVYLSTLKKLVKNYNFNLEHHNRRYQEINQELSKANITTFEKRQKPPLKIVEQE